MLGYEKNRAKLTKTIPVQLPVSRLTQTHRLVKTSQLNLSQTNSVGAELLVVDETGAANRLTL